MAALSNIAIQVPSTLTNTTTLFGKVSVNSFPVAYGYAKMRITNDNTGELSYTLIGLFTDYFIQNALIKSAGKPTPTINLNVTLQVSQAGEGIAAEFDVSDQVVGDISVTVPEDSASSASLRFSVMRPSENFSFLGNPFATIPTTEGTSPIQIGARIIIKSSISYGSPVEITFQHTIFTGRIASMSFDASQHAIEVSCVDMSYDVSLASSRVSRDYLAIQDNQFEEDIKGELIAEDGTTGILIDSNGLGNHRYVELSLSFARATPDLKMLALASNGLVSNDTDLGDILLNETSALISETPPEQTTTRKNIIRIDVLRTTGLFQQYLQRANPPTIFRVTYQLSDVDALAVVENAPTKSQVIETILKDAQISDYEIERKNSVEDEPAIGNIIANREFPLDFIKKISVPQTWYARYDAYGSLKIGREVLASRPDITFDDVLILDNTLSIKKNISDVVNTQEVAGALISTTQGAAPATPGMSPPTSVRNSRWVKVGSKEINIATEEIIPKFGISEADLVPGLFTLHCIVACNLRTVSVDGILDGGLFYGNLFGQQGAYEPRLVIKTDTGSSAGELEPISVRPSSTVSAIVDTGRAPGFGGPSGIGSISIFPGWLAYRLSNNDFNFASYGTYWGFLSVDMIKNSTGVNESKWFGSVPPVILPSAFSSSLNKPIDGLFTNLIIPSRIVDVNETFYASVTIRRAMNADRETGIVTLRGFTGTLEIYLRVRNPGSPTFASALATQLNRNR